LNLDNPPKILELDGDGIALCRGIFQAGLSQKQVRDKIAWSPARKAPPSVYIFLRKQKTFETDRYVGKTTWLRTII
jgi:hypothetical protein